MTAPQVEQDALAAEAQGLGAREAASRRSGGVAAALAQSMRPYQWTKNLLVFAALVFAHQLNNPAQFIRALAAFAAFCAASSALYLVNDILDAPRDRRHPEKCFRPIASGRLGKGTAWAAALALGAAGLAVSAELGTAFVAIMGLYVAITCAYSLGLKNVFLLDVLIISSGFVIRALAGAVALSVTFSNWLVVCTLFLALFLSLSKRRHEIELLEDQAVHHREVLGHYTAAYLDSLNLIVACATLITYTIYTCSPEVVNRLGTDKLYLTLPFVVYGLFRYLYLLHTNTQGGDPARTLLKDRPLAITVALWAGTCIAIIYGKI